jgi:amino-acid N-acetyltransferase
LVPTVELRPAEPRDRAYVEELLAENDLPTDDLDAAYPSLFVCEVPSGGSAAGDSSASERVGVGGLQVEGDPESQSKEGAGLLRSLAVKESARGSGYGTAVCERLLDRARAADLDSVFLLTTTAADFFADLGFEEVERERVPDPIRETAEFSDICPASATCMKRPLDQS